MHIKQQTGKRKNILHTFAPSRAKTKTLATNSEKLYVNTKLPVHCQLHVFSVFAKSAGRMLEKQGVTF
jgi:hypothetical protein